MGNNIKLILKKCVMDVMWFEIAQIRTRRLGEGAVFSSVNNFRLP
jgi:hypothetical protein